MASSRAEPPGRNEIRSESRVGRWPGLAATAGCSCIAAAAVALDAAFSAREGYLARPAYYDGAGYLFFARTYFELLRGLHLRTLFHLLINAITPGWNLLLAFQYFIFGPGEWQGFTARFWPVALMVVLAYWLVRRRTSRTLAIVAAVTTALTPMISAGVRSSSLEFLTGNSNYLENWYLDDLRPDILAIALILWAVAILAEHSNAPSRASFVISALFAVAAVLIKPSTSPLLGAVWAGTLVVVWFLNRRRPDATRAAAIGAGVFGLLLAPWAILGGITNVISYLYEASVVYGGVYNTSDNFLLRVWYFLAHIPTDLGPVEGWLVIAGASAVTVALVRRALGPPELIYGGVAVAFYVVFSLTATRNTHIPLWTSAALWIYVLAGLARLAGRVRWAARRPAPVLLPALGLYTLSVYGLGAFALANWPDNEHSSAVQLSAVTAQLAAEIDHRLMPSDCFVSSPGPGWPASIQATLVNSRGQAPGSIGIDPSRPTQNYVDAAKSCAAIITFREDISVVAQAFSALPAYQPYYRAIDQWVRGATSGYSRDGSWSLSDLPPYDPHPLGRYQGLSLTVELFVRSQLLT